MYSSKTGEIKKKEKKTEKAGNTRLDHVLPANKPEYR